MARDKNFQIRVSEQEKWRIEERAREHGYRPAAFMRMLSLYGGMEVEGISYEPPRAPAALEQRDRQPDYELRSARARIENDPSDLNATLDEKGSVVKAQPSSDEDVIDKVKETWISHRALQLKARLSSRAARRQAEIEWEEGA